MLRVLLLDLRFIYERHSHYILLPWFNASIRWVALLLWVLIFPRKGKTFFSRGIGE